MPIVIGLFEMNKTTKQSMVIQLWFLLEKFHLLHQVIAFAKDESFDLIVIATTLHSIIDCKLLSFFCIYDSKCFGHVMFSMLQKTIKICFELKNVNVKEVRLV
jgi:hypothetical protein